MNNDIQKMAAISTTHDIKIELATKPAVRLFQGRAKTAKRHGILGIPGFSKILKGIEQAVREDDPYADFHYLTIEQAISDLTDDLAEELNDIQSYISENVPPAVHLPDNQSKNPMVVPIRFASRLGFQLVYQLLQVDQIVLKVLLANHIGILSNKQKHETIARVERRVRSVLHLVFAYKHIGVTRDDMASNNKKAQAAKAAMGDLESGYLNGTVRSENAPALPMKRLQTLKTADLDSGKGEPEEEDSAEAADKPAARKSPVKKKAAKKGVSKKASKTSELESRIDSVIAEADAEEAVQPRKAATA